MNTKLAPRLIALLFMFLPCLAFSGEFQSLTCNVSGGEKQFAFKAVAKQETLVIEEKMERLGSLRISFAKENSDTPNVFIEYKSDDILRFHVSTHVAMIPFENFAYGSMNLGSKVHGLFLVQCLLR